MYNRQHQRGYRMDQERSNRAVSAFVFILVCFAQAAVAQVYSGSLTGVVTDQSGAVVPGAKVTLVDINKGFSFTAVTDSVGRYILRSLPPSTYRFTAEAAGFRSYAQDNITLDINQNATINVPLQVGSGAESIQVEASAPVLATEDAVTGQNLNRRFINDLPLLSRSVFDLAFLAPGISEAAGSSFGPQGYGNNFISNGGRNSTADILLDGVSAVNHEQNGGIQVPLYTPSVDAVQEFTVRQSNFSADIGFSGATVVTMVTRSGTNQFHGSAYEFLRNQKLDANNFFNNANGVPIPPLRRNQFGFTVGGPIRRDKTFFFFDYEGTRQRTFSSNRAGVPSALERTGNFGEVCTLQGGSFDSSGMCSNQNGQLWDPYSSVYSADAGGPVRQNFIPFNNLITFQSAGNPNLQGTPYQLAARPGNLIDPVAFKMMQYYPLPNVGVGTAAYDRFNNWIGSGVNRSTNDQFDIKVDQRFSDSDLMSAKFSWDRNPSEGANCFGNALDPCTQGPSSGTARLFALNHTHTFNPRTLLNFSYGITRSLGLTRGIAADFKNFDPVKTLGLPPYITSAGFNASPAVVILGGYGQAGGNDSLGAQAWSVLKYGQETHHLLSNLNRMQGRHEIKFGGEVRMHRINFLQAGAPAGYFNYDFNTTSQMPFSGGGDALAGFLIGVGGPGNSGYYEWPPSVSTQSFQYATFFQDNWRVSDRLTLNLGLRYDLDLPRTERYNRMNYIDPYITSPVSVPAFPHLRGGDVFVDSKHRKPSNTDGDNFGPRFGYAYRLTPKTVLRGGYGLFYSLSKAAAVGTGALGFDGYDQTTNWLLTYHNDGATPWGRLSDPFPGGGPIVPPGSSHGLLTNLGQGINGPIKTWNEIPYEQTWSFGVQREIFGGVLIDASYVGKKGTRLYFGGFNNLNFLTPDIADRFRTDAASLNQFVPNPFYGVITEPSSPLSSQQIPRWRLLVPYPQFDSVNATDPPWSNSTYHSFQLRVEKRFARGLQFLATYTNSKSIDDSSVAGGGTTWLGGSTSLQDPNRRYLERSLSQYDIPQILQFSYVYQLPFGHGRAFGRLPAPLEFVLGGWQTNGIWRFASGQPIALSLQGGQSVPTYGSQRPNLVGTLRRNTGPNFRTKYFANPEVAVVPPPYVIGNAPRVMPNLRAPGTNVASLSLFKEFSLHMIREESRLEYRIEAFNALNHPQFCAPGATVNSGSFGTITCQANSPREVQMALKFYW